VVRKPSSALSLNAKLKADFAGNSLAHQKFWNVRLMSKEDTSVVNIWKLSDNVFLQHCHLWGRLFCYRAQPTVDKTHFHVLSLSLPLSGSQSVATWNQVGRDIPTVAEPLCKQHSEIQITASNWDYEKVSEKCRWKPRVHSHNKGNVIQTAVGYW
jgi:hypothetical protein